MTIVMCFKQKLQQNLFRIHVCSFVPLVSGSRITFYMLAINSDHVFGSYIWKLCLHAESSTESNKRPRLRPDRPTAMWVLPWFWFPRPDASYLRSGKPHSALNQIWHVKDQGFAQTDQLQSASCPDFAFRGPMLHVSEAASLSLSQHQTKYQSFTQSNPVANRG